MASIAGTSVTLSGARAPAPRATRTASTRRTTQSCRRLLGRRRRATSATASGLAPGHDVLLAGAGVERRRRHARGRAAPGGRSRPRPASRAGRVLEDLAGERPAEPERPSRSGGQRARARRRTSGASRCRAARARRGRRRRARRPRSRASRRRRRTSGRCEPERRRHDGRERRRLVELPHPLNLVDWTSSAVSGSEPPWARAALRTRRGGATSVGLRLRPAGGESSQFSCRPSGVRSRKLQTVQRLDAAAVVK